jgi:cyclophilin family peptidyl-prolyl cis-trans isomerase
MNRFSFALLVGIFLAARASKAQNAAPIVSNPLGNVSVYAGAPTRSIDLTNVFQDPDLTTAVRMDSVYGPIDIALYERQKPITVANFLRYVDERRYFMTDPTTKQEASSFIHRSVPGFVIQGGGFIGTVNPSAPDRLQATQVGTLPAIQNEPGISNKRGTLAMAKLANNPNSATSQWFINLADNSHNVVNGTDQGLDVQNGGFTVFARVIGDGMDIADRIANVPIYNFGAPFDSLPLRDWVSPNPVKIPNLISLPSIARIPSVHSPLTFTATSSDPAIIDAKVSESNLLVTGKAVGTANITVTATDVDGASVSQTFAVTAAAAPGRLVNISTRLEVRANNEVMIGGFILVGDAPKRAIIRAIGPSLSSQGITGVLADPTLELYDSDGALISSSDSWADATKQDIIDTGIPPTNSKEAALLVTLPSSSSGTAYTAIVKGLSNATGIGLVEVYDLDSGAGSRLANIATRGRVGTTEDKVMIGGFFVGGTESKRVLFRAIGPSLAGAGVSGALADPTLQVVNSDGTQIDANNDWQTSAQANEIQQTGIAPSNAKESAALQTLPPGAYTAIVRSNNNTAGIGSIEIYQL